MSDKQELSSAKIEQGWRETFSTENPFCPCNLKSFTKAVRWAERAMLQAAPAEPAIPDGSRDANDVFRGAAPADPQPLVWIQPDHLQKARITPFLCRVEPTRRMADFVPLYAGPVVNQSLTTEREVCEWHEEDPGGPMPDTYATSCGELWSFTDGGPAENRVKFCHRCGKTVKVVPYQQPVDDDAAPGVPVAHPTQESKA